MESASPGEPGHPLSTGEQGSGRWDNPDLYSALYFAKAPEAAVGERFASLSRWRGSMLIEPQLASAERCLAEVELRAEAGEILDLDDAAALAARDLRPTHIVIRNPARTQRIAREAFGDGYLGMTWWSRYHPEWPLCVLWDSSAIHVIGVASLRGHPALLKAGATLLRAVDQELTG